MGYWTPLTWMPVCGVWRYCGLVPVVMWVTAAWVKTLGESDMVLQKLHGAVGEEMHLNGASKYLVKPLTSPMHLVATLIIYLAAYRHIVQL